MTSLEALFVTFLMLGGIVLILYGLEFLHQGDKQAALDNKCPPHKWEWVLECAKCKRRPNGLQDKGWGTWPTFPTV